MLNRPPWPERLAQVYLATGALLYAAIGVAGLMAPGWLAARVDLVATSATSLSELRAFFGAQSLVLAGVFALGARCARWRWPALTLFVVLALAFGATRVVSLAVDGAPNTLVIALLTMEAVGAVVGVPLLRWRRRRVPR